MLKTTHIANERTIYLVIGILLLTLLQLPLTQALALSSTGTTSLKTAGEITYTCGAMFALPVIIACLTLGIIAIVKPAYNLRVLVWLASAVALVMSLFGAMRATQIIRHNAFKNVPQNSTPLIAAIKQYVRDHGKSPPDLHALVPRYISQIPGTGVGAHPEFMYRTKSHTKPNQWELYVSTPIGIINWDQMLYLPHENYPKQGYGGTLEPIGNWAYVHE